MGFRIRKSIKVGKNTRMNIGKKGVGLSFGTRGLRRTFHSSGRKTTSAGLPGTGLYYTKSSSGKRSGSHQPAASKQKQQKIEENQEAVELFNHYVHQFTSLHKRPTASIDWEQIKANPAPFDAADVGPLQAKALKAYKNYTPNFIHRLFRLEKKKHKQLEQAINEAKQQDQINYQEWEQKHQLANQVLQGDRDAFCQVIREKHAFASLKDWGSDFQVDVKDTRTIEVEFRVKPKKVVPEKTLSLTKTGKLSRKKMTKTNYFKLVQDFTCGSAMQVARSVFALLPADKVIVHILEDRVNPATGHRKPAVMLSVAFEQDTMNWLNFDNLNPADAMANFTHHMNFLKTKGFRPVKRIQD